MKSKWIFLTLWSMWLLPSLYIFGIGVLKVVDVCYYYTWVKTEARIYKADFKELKVMAKEGYKKKYEHDFNYVYPTKEGNKVSTRYSNVRHVPIDTSIYKAGEKATILYNPRRAHEAIAQVHWHMDKVRFLWAGVLMMIVAVLMYLGIRKKYFPIKSLYE